MSILSNYVFLLPLLFGLLSAQSQSLIDYNENWSVTLLRKYIRINTAHPNPENGYVQAKEFLRELAADIGLEFNMVNMEPPNLFAVVITWKGQNPELKSILLNSHIDLGPVDPKNWPYPPFDAFKTPEGRIYGSGILYSKGLTIAHLEAVRKLKFAGFQPLRTVYITVMPDAELGGLRGTKAFLETDYFKNMNVGLDLDWGPPGTRGGTTNESETLSIVYAEKNSWKFNVTATGISSHGATLPKYTAPQRLQVVIDRLMEFRQKQYNETVQQNGILLNITTVNLVRLGGGISDFIIPSEVWASFDMRIWVTPEWTFKNADEMLNAIIEEARLGSNDSSRENVTLQFLLKSEESGRTAVDDSNPWWTALQQTCADLNVCCKPTIIRSTSDGRFFRNLNISTFGLNPFQDIHVDNPQGGESIQEISFLQGVDRFAKFISAFTMIPESTVS